MPTASSSTINGLAIEEFSGMGVVAKGVSAVRITGDYISLAHDGQTTRSNNKQ